MTPAVTAVSGSSNQITNGEALYEIVDGQYVELPPMGAFEADVAQVLDGHLKRFAPSQDLGRVRSEVLFMLDQTGKLQRRLDVAFVSYQRWPKNRRIPRTEAWPVVPNLGVEVVSPSNTAAEIHRKIHEYFRHGMELLWVIYPDDEEIYVYESPSRLRVLTKVDDLDGGSVLPGFRLPVASLFEGEPDETPPEEE